MSPRIALCLCVALATIVFEAGPAHATKFTVVVRSGGSGADKAATMVGHFARKAFENDRRYDFVYRDEALGSAEVDRARQAFRYANELAGQGREAYETLELDVAVELLNTANSVCTVLFS